MNMDWRYLAFGVLALSVLGEVMNLHADEKAPAATSNRMEMEKVLDRYSRIHRDMVTSSLGQIRDDATTLWVAAGKVKDKKLSSDIQNAAKRMISSSSTGMGHPSFPDATNDFRRLSVPIVEWVKKFKPEGWTVIHCPKLNEDWVQRKDEEIQNPYSGDDMRRCGEKVS